MTSDQNQTARCGATLDDGTVCGTMLNEADHGRFNQSSRVARDHGMTNGVLLFDCPDCGNTQATCPTCGGEDGGPGWFRGESTGNLLPCPNCNQEEEARQRRRGKL